MTYLSASRKNNKSNFAKIFLGIIVVIFLSYVFVPRIYDSLASLFSIKNNFSFGSKDVLSLQEENNRLSREVLELRSQVESYEIFSSNVSAVEGDRLLAKVLKRPPNTLFDTIVIDRGRIDGVDVGLPVYTGNTLIGTVKEVFENSGVVELITFPGLIREAVFAGNNELDIKGVGNGAFEAEVPKNVTINIGDTVVGTDRNATLYGVINHIEDEEGSVYRRVFIDSPFNLYKESWVEIKIK